MTDDRRGNSGEGGAQRSVDSVDLGLVGIGVGLAEVKVRHRLEWHDVHVHVRHFETGDHEADALGRQQLALRLPDALGNGHQMGRRVGRKVGPVIDLGSRNNEHMARRERPDVHEGDAHVVLPDETAGNLAVDDAGEDGGHVRIVGCGA